MAIGTMDEQAPLEQVKTLVAPVLARQATELVDCTMRQEGRQFVLRFLVDTPQGITLEQCAILNRQISAALEEANLFEHPYLLEVASPGLDRPLVTQRDFERVLGDQISVTSQADGRTRTHTGRLMHVDEHVLLLEVRPGDRISIPRVAVKMSKRVIAI